MIKRPKGRNQEYAGVLIHTVGEVDPLEAYFETHELFESTMEARPISVTRTEVYGVLSVLIKNRAAIVSLTFHMSTSLPHDLPPGELDVRKEWD